jgi:hypothetical protein
MKKLGNVQTYHLIYDMIRDKPRYRLNPIAKALGLSGRGRSHTTAKNYINKLYAKGISLYPNLILRNFENCFTTAYFLKVDDQRNTTSMFWKLSKLAETNKISYMLLLSGEYDFFVTSKYDLTFDDELTIKKKSILYNPLYTNPTGWELDMKDAFKKISESDLEKGTLQRDIEDFLFWEDTEFRIFETMKSNVQISFTEVARRLQCSPSTVRKYYYDSILPCCDIAHYFFPKGYDNYHQSLVILESDYEKGLVDAFSKLPCTTYVFPLEDEMALGVFHEGVNDLMFSLKKIEEKGFLRSHLLLVPLSWE